MSYGVPYLSPLPTPGVTPSPTFEAQLVAHSQETETKLEQDITENDITLATGDFKQHVNRPIELGAAGWTFIGATYDPANFYALAAAGGNTASRTLEVQPGQRIRSVQLHGRNSGVAWVLAVFKIDKASSTPTQIGTVNSGVIAGTIEPKSIALTEVVLDGFAYVVRWTSGAAGDRLIGGRFEVDRP